jgi:hypothetical protein
MIYVYISVVVVIIAIAVWYKFFRVKKVPYLLSNDEHWFLANKNCIPEFTFTDIVSHGEYATSFGAVQNETGRKVVLRVLKKDWIYNRDICEQFHQKASILEFIYNREDSTSSFAPVDHRIANFNGELRPYIVQGLLEDGISLQEYIRRNGGRISHAMALDCIKQLLPIVTLCHNERIWLREFSPQNIIIQQKGSGFIYTLVDIGIPYSTMLFSEEVREKKAPFYSPEDIRNEPIYTPSSDVFAVAMLYLYCVTGSTIYSPSHESQQGAIIAKGLDEHIRNRYADVSDLVIALETITQQTMVGSVSQKSEDIFSQVRTERSLREYVRESDATLSSQKESGKDEGAASRKPSLRSRLPKFQLAPQYLFAFSGALLLWFFTWLFETIKNGLNTPKKVVKKALVFIGLLAVGIWYFMFLPTEGTVFLNIVEWSDRIPRPGIGNVIVDIEAIDYDGNRITDLKMTNNNVKDGEDQEGAMILSSDRDGIVKFDYFYRWFKPEKIRFKVKINPNTDKYLGQETILDVGKTREFNKKVNIFLRPVVENDIAFHVPSAKSMFQIPVGSKEPKTITLKVYVADNIGKASKSAQVILKQGRAFDKEIKMQETSNGNFEVRDLVFNESYAIHYRVEDSSLMKITFETDLQDRFKLQNPPEQILTKAQGKSIEFPIEKAKNGGGGGGGDCTIPPTAYTIQIVNGSGKAMNNAKVLINEKPINYTNVSGEVVTMVFENPCDFWKTKPRIDVEYQSIIGIRKKSIQVKQPKDMINVIRLKIDNESIQQEEL